jgi:hypothetical protein
MTRTFEPLSGISRSSIFSGFVLPHFGHEGTVGVVMVNPDGQSLASRLFKISRRIASQDFDLNSGDYKRASKPLPQKMLSERKRTEAKKPYISAVLCTKHCLISTIFQL